jgi:nucleoside-diphosphate-sugar epimerase
MNILVTGATGFIASQIVTDLLNAGHNVTCCVRNMEHAKNLFPRAKIISCNFFTDTSPEIWQTRLSGIDVVINSVGILHHPYKKRIWAIHYETPKALFTAAVAAHVKKIIQISASGVDKGTVEYAKSKKAADDFLLTLPVQAFILRPSLVYGRGSYGGTSLFRGLAGGLPWIIPVPGNGKQEFQPIHLSDLSTAILKLLDVQGSTTGTVLNVAGPEKINLRDILTQMRAWLGFNKAKVFRIPLIFIQIGSWFGSLLPNTAMNVTSFKMLKQKIIASPEDVAHFNQTIGFIPKNFTAGLYSQPSTVQDHWHAKLYILKPLLQFSIAFVWIFSAICSLFLYPWEGSYELLSQVGVNEAWQPILFYGASLLNALLGFATLLSYRPKLTGVLQCIVIFIYSAILTIKLPGLWIEPFAPIAKNIPMFVATLIYIALASDR